MDPAPTDDAPRPDDAPPAAPDQPRAAPDEPPAAPAAGRFPIGEDWLATLVGLGLVVLVLLGVVTKAMIP